MAGAVAAAATVIGCGDSTTPYVDAATQPEIDVLNFALNLEYLEATFYSYIVTGNDLDGSLTGGGPSPTGTPAQITFPNAQINDLFAEIYFDEMSHVAALRTALGQVAIARPQARPPRSAARILRLPRRSWLSKAFTPAPCAWSPSSRTRPTQARLPAMYRPTAMT